MVEKDRNYHDKYFLTLVFASVLLLSVELYAPSASAAGVLDSSAINDTLSGFNAAIGSVSTAPSALPSGCQMPPTSNSSGTINKIQCGLYASDPLNNETMTQQQLQTGHGYWVYGGDAPAENAPYSVYRDTQGLHIGVQAPSNGTYAGYYAVTPNTNAMLFHAVVTSPASTIPYGFFQNGLYVQTSQAPVNYVTCVAITSKVATIWAIVHTYGGPTGSLAFQTLWFDPSSNQPLTRDCTIVTNGQNYLDVYLDHNLVYSSNTLALGMPAPFNAFLEPQSSYDGQQLIGTYNDFYSTILKNILVKNNPSNAQTAKVIDTSGNVLATASVTLGNSTIDIAKYHLPVNANVKVFDSNNVQLASTPVMETLYGGDVYSVIGTQGNATISIPSTSGIISSATDTVKQAVNTTTSTITSANQTTTSTISTAVSTTTSTASQVTNTASGIINSQPSLTGATIKVSSTYGNGTELDGMYMELQQNGNDIQTGSTPVTFNVTLGQTYSVVANDFTGAYFNHWKNGSPSRTIQVTALTPSTSEEAIYTYTPQPATMPQPGPNTVTVTSTFLNQTTLNGMYVQIRQNGNIVGDGFTPITFANLLPTIQYETVMYSDQNVYMRHYSDGTLLRYHFVTPTILPITLDAVYENVPSSQAAHLGVTALDSNGNVLGSSQMVNGSVVATPGMYMDLIPPAQINPYTATFSGAGDLPWALFNGQTYTVEMSKGYGKYQFDHWQDNNSTNPVRSFTLNGDNTGNVVIYKIVS